jgi:hypothetical protein
MDTRYERGQERMPKDDRTSIRVDKSIQRKIRLIAAKEDKTQGATLQLLVDLYEKQGK